MMAGNKRQVEPVPGVGDDNDCKKITEKFHKFFCTGKKLCFSIVRWIPADV